MNPRLKIFHTNRIVFIFCGLLTVLATTAPVNASEPLVKSSHKVTSMDKLKEQAKRRAPTVVPPVEIENVRYEVLRSAKARGFKQDGGILAAIDTAKGAELWTLTIYQQGYDPNEESDGQEVYITSLAPTHDKNVLRVENEAHKAYLVNLKTHEISYITEE